MGNEVEIRAAPSNERGSNGYVVTQITGIAYTQNLVCGYQTNCLRPVVSPVFRNCRNWLPVDHHVYI